MTTSGATPWHAPAAVLVRRGDYDRARRLCTSHELWLDAALVLRASCSHGHPEVGPNVLSAWLDALPPDRLRGAATDCSCAVWWLASLTPSVHPQRHSSSGRPTSSVPPAT